MLPRAAGIKRAVAFFLRYKSLFSLMQYVFVSKVTKFNSACLHEICKTNTDSLKFLINTSRAHVFSEIKVKLFTILLSHCIN